MGGGVVEWRSRSRHHLLDDGRLLTQVFHSLGHLIDVGRKLILHSLTLGLSFSSLSHETLQTVVELPAVREAQQDTSDSSAPFLSAAAHFKSISFCAAEWCKFLRNGTAEVHTATLLYVRDEMERQGARSYRSFWLPCGSDSWRKCLVWDPLRRGYCVWGPRMNIPSVFRTKHCTSLSPLKQGVLRNLRYPIFTFADIPYLPSQTSHIHLLSRCAMKVAMGWRWKSHVVHKLE